MDKRKKAIEILEVLQLLSYKFHNEINNIDSSVEKTLKDYPKEDGYDYSNYISKMIEPISEYQDKFHYNLYLDMFKKLEISYKKIFNQTITKTPVFGTLPTIEFSAQTYRTKYSDEIIAISQGLRWFYFSISKIVSLSLTIVEIENGMDVITDKKQIKENINIKNLDCIFAKLLIEYYIIGGCDHIGIEFPTKMHRFLTMKMSRAINYFILAHEYTHYCHNHSNVNKEQLDIWLNELDADYYAIRLTLDAMSDEVNLTYILWGIYIFLKFMETFEIYDLALTNNANFKTHPPFEIRKGRFFKVINELNMTKQFLDIDAFDYMFQLLRGEFSSLIEEFQIIGYLISIPIRLIICITC